MVAEAAHELVLMTYSATPHKGIRAALASAVSRGVSVTAVVETPQGAGNALSCSEPAAAFAGTPGVQLRNCRSPSASRTAPRCTPNSPSPTSECYSYPARTSHNQG